MACSEYRCAGARPAKTRSGLRSDPRRSSGRPRARRCVDRESMVWIPGGDFRWVRTAFYREERPARRESVDGFWIDREPVTNADFAAFVRGDRLSSPTSERPPDPAMYPDADPVLLVPGSSVFTKPAGPVGLRDHQAWWAYVPGANWRHPEGPESSFDDRADHPVVHVAYEDVCGLCRLGRQGDCRPRPNGNSRRAAGSTTRPMRGARTSRRMAGSWRTPGRAVSRSRISREDGYEGTSPVDAFPAKRLRPLRHDRQCLGVDGQRLRFAARRRRETILLPVASEQRSRGARRVVKGGSHLCAPNYCLRYRPAARQSQSLDTSTMPYRISLRRARRRELTSSLSEPFYMTITTDFRAEADFFKDAISGYRGAPLTSPCWIRARDARRRW